MDNVFDPGDAGDSKAAAALEEHIATNKEQLPALEQEISELQAAAGRMKLAHQVRMEHAAAQKHVVENEMMGKKEEDAREELRDIEIDADHQSYMLSRLNKELSQLQLERERFAHDARIKGKEQDGGRPAEEKRFLPGLIERNQELAKVLADKEAQAKSLEIANASHVAVLKKMREQVILRRLTGTSKQKHPSRHAVRDAIRETLRAANVYK